MECSSLVDILKESALLNVSPQKIARQAEFHTDTKAFLNHSSRWLVLEGRLDHPQKDFRCAYLSLCYGKLKHLP